MTGVLVLFYIVYGNRLVDGALDQLDEDRRARAEHIGERAVRAWRGYLYVGLIQIISVTIVFWIALWALDLPAPFVLALTVGVLSLVPLIGIIVGGLPALLFAMATAEPATIVPIWVCSWPPRRSRRSSCDGEWTPRRCMWARPCRSSWR